MRKIREILRLKYQHNLSNRQIAKNTLVSRPVISQYLFYFDKSGLRYQDIQHLNDELLFEALQSKKIKESEKFKILSEKFPYFALELKKTGVTLKKLWEEYIEENPFGYSHSQFFRYYQNWRNTSELTMHIDHKAGDKMFVDFTGKHLTITDKITGNIKDVEVFVAILGASQYTYVEAQLSQNKHHFIRSCENGLWYFQGVPKAIVPDCLKSAVTKAHKYEPDINPEYLDFAKHYNTTVLPARPYHPKDKALVENAVKIVYSRIFAALRNSVFYSLQELNQAIFKELELYNNRPMQKTKISRFSLYQDIEKQALMKLPVSLYELKDFCCLKVQFNYHIYLSKDKHYYSVPYRYAGKSVEVIYTDSIVEIYYQNIRIAFHKREFGINCYTTCKSHMPEHHKWVSEWSPERFSEWAEKIGENTKIIIDSILQRKEHPEQSFKVCLGILSLAKKYSKERLEAACKKAKELSCLSMKSINNILEKRLENSQLELDSFANSTLPKHENIRGSDYYQ